MSITIYAHGKPVYVDGNLAEETCAPPLGQE